MVDVKPFEVITEKHWSDYNLHGYMYSNVFSEIFINQISRVIDNLTNKQNHTQYLTHTTNFKLNNQVVKIGSSNQSNRYQETPFDLFFLPGWDDCTADTVKNWAEEQYKTIDPVWYRVIKLFEDMPPYVSEKNKWLCYRLHINVLNYTENFGLHRDGGYFIFRDNFLHSRMWSTTVYLQDHQEGDGGELFLQEGWVYKPVRNAAVTFNGHQVLHGVTENVKSNKKPRLAFTMRWVHVDDLYFANTSGYKLYDKFLYD